MKYKINLIGKKSTSFFDKVLYFFLNYLRYVLVITQLVVIGVLFFRFRIDQNIIDLKDSIQQKEEIIEVVKPILAETTKIQKKENSIKQILKEQDTFSNSLSYMFSLFPESATLTQLQVEDDQITLIGEAQNAQHLQSFYKRLKNEKKFGEVSLSNIVRNPTGYNFTLKLKGYKG